jgi:hypothetical protein
MIRGLGNSAYEILESPSTDAPSWQTYIPHVDLAYFYDSCRSSSVGLGKFGREAHPTVG